MIQCPKCHSTNVIQTDTNRFECPYCGNVFTASQANSFSQGYNSSNGNAVPGEKKRITAALLALFLGGIGIHYFYLNKPVAGLVFLLLFWTVIPAILAFIMSLVMFTMSDDEFQQKYVNNPSAFPMF